MMKEAVWQDIENPHELIFCLIKDLNKENELSTRKVRLFCHACMMRLKLELAPFPGANAAVEMANRFADGECTEAELANAKSLAEGEIRHGVDYEARNALCAAAWTASPKMDAISIGRSVAEGATLARGELGSEHYFAEYAAQCNLLRDVFGNLFYRIARTELPLSNDVIELAQKMYATRDFKAMPQLGEHLEAAGCSNAVVLSHCRQTTPHVRGCWVLDLILGKE
jgi:hypothetical protein